jgi:hypothetical protein
MGEGYLAQQFLTSTLDGGKWLASLSGHFSSGRNTPGSHCMVVWIHARQNNFLYTIVLCVRIHLKGVENISSIEGILSLPVTQGSKHRYIKLLHFRTGNVAIVSVGATVQVTKHIYHLLTSSRFRNCLLILSYWTRNAVQVHGTICHNSLLLRQTEFASVSGHNQIWKETWIATEHIVGFQFQTGQVTFLSYTVSKPVLELTQPPMKWIPGVIGMRRETNLSTPSSTDDKNYGNLPPFSHIS